MKEEVARNYTAVEVDRFIAAPAIAFPAVVVRGQHSVLPISGAGRFQSFGAGPLPFQTAGE
jgi:hypothetical protein